ncbi:hypothetical protein EVA_22448, partial [gut metagenome]
KFCLALNSYKKQKKEVDDSERKTDSGNFTQSYRRVRNETSFFPAVLEGGGFKEYESGTLDPLY